MTDTDHVDNNGEETPREPEQSRETVGDILRKERVTRRITIETIAKDLKLNATYIKALEANNYDQLPADPYIRVYLRSMAGYLMLDPDRILRKFYEDRGIKPSEYKDDRSTQITITMKKPESRRTPWMMIGIVIAVIAVLIFIADKSGWISPSSSSIQPQESEQAVIPQADSNALIDSMGAAQAALATVDTTKEKLQTQASPDTLHNTSSGDSLRMELSARNDSVWVQVFTDGISWRNYIHAGAVRSFAAADSFNIHFGNVSLARLSLNGASVVLPAKGVSFCKIDSSGLKFWDQSKWNRVFKGRLK